MTDMERELLGMGIAPLILIVLFIVIPVAVGATSARRAWLQGQNKLGYLSLGAIFIYMIGVKAIPLPIDRDITIFIWLTGVGLLIYCAFQVRRKK